MSLLQIQSIGVQVRSGILPDQIYGVLTKDYKKAGMNRAAFVIIVVGVVLVSFSVLGAAAPRQPNFVFIIADDCTFRDIGCYGGQALTPNIDRLATQGLKFEQCFQTVPMCSPTRHTIYTGLYPVKSGAWPNHTFAYDHVKSIVQYLKPFGYRVALSGKRHIAPESVFPFEYSGKKTNNPNMNAIERLIKESKEAGNPFCLFACSNEPHTPWNKGEASKYPPDQVKLPSYIADTPTVRADFSRYLAEITYFDSQVGEVLELLDQYGIADDTVVMVTSEQGNAFPFAKWTCYDNGLQTAMIVRWPGRIPAGQTTDAMVEYVDIVPTMVELAGGIPVPVLDGKSFLPVLERKTDHHKDYSYGLMTARGIFFGPDAYPIRSVRSDRFKLIFNLNSKEKFTNAATENSDYYRSIVDAARAGDQRAAELVDKFQNRPTMEFFDVVKDPNCQTNLADNPEYAAEISKLRKELDKWMTSQGDNGLETEYGADRRCTYLLKEKRGHKKQRSSKSADDE